MKSCLAILLVASAALLAQNEPVPQLEDEFSYVRPVSGGITLGAFVPALVPDYQVHITVEDPPSDTDYFTEGASSRGTFGGSLQLALGRRWAFATQVLMRKVSYTVDTHRTSGVDNPNILGDDRDFLRTQEATHGWFVDVPLTLRLYNIERYDRGTRAFFEFGGAFRRVMGIKTSIESTNRAGDKSCCDTTPASPNNSLVTGATVGFGLQFIDDFGIRSVPELRYTRWFSQPFTNEHMSTRQNQLEFVVTFGF